MDSGDENEHIRFPKKNRNRFVIDSDSDSNTSQNGSTSSAPNSPDMRKPKKPTRKICDSSSGSDDNEYNGDDMEGSSRNNESDESDDNDESDENESDASDASDESDPAIDQSSRPNITDNVADQLANMLIRTKDDGDDDDVIPESDNEIDASKVDSDNDTERMAIAMPTLAIGNDSVEEIAATDSEHERESDSAKDFEASVLVSGGETDDEKEELRQCYSPRTRRSIVGHRSKVILTSDESDVYDDDDNHKEISISPINKYHENTDVAYDIDDNDSRPLSSRKLLQNGMVAESTSIMPQRKRPLIQSSLAANSFNVSIDDSSDQSASVSKSIFQPKDINDQSSDQDETIASKSKSSNSVVMIDSSDDENQIPNRRLTMDFKSLENVSTPQRSNLVQPTIKSKLTKNSKGIAVSQEHYDNNIVKLSALNLDLEKNRDLLQRLGPTLPDGGKNLKYRISNLERDVDKQKNYIDTIYIEEDMPVSQPTAAATVKPISWAEIEKGANAIQSKYTGVVGAMNFAQERELVMTSLKNAHAEMEACPPEGTLADTPKGLKISLMPHQQYALAWMLWREQQKHPCGGILADDMGLGKTLSIIALVLASEEIRNAKEKNNESSDDDDNDDDDDDDDDEVGEVKTNNKWAAKGRRSDYYYGGTLVICPASLINQWEKEVENRVKRQHCSVRMHHGNNRESNPRLLSRNTMVITTYGVINSEQKSRGALFKIKWERIVLDEAHIIRNHATAMAQSCCELKGKRRWGLTGTPIQNKEMDLFSLWKFLRVKGFDQIAKFKRWMQISNADGLNRLNARLRPMLLRRTKLELQNKGQLQSLPEKHIEIISIELSTDEMNVYSRILSLSQSLFAQFMNQRTSRQEMNNMVPHNKDMFRKMHEKFRKMQGNVEEVKSSQILVLLTRLRQICDHPGLIDAMLHDEDVMGSDESEDEQLQDLDLLAQINNLNIQENGEMNNNSNDDENISRASSKVLLRSNPVFDFNRQSSKCRKVLEIIRQIQSEGDDKIVVVSQWTSVLNIVANFLNRNKFNFVELNGKTAIKLRNDIVVNFNKPTSPQRIMLLSLVAGGVGLNLTGANHLILFDPHWNPQLESQAFDRVYRVGQSKPVKIYKLMCENTVEMGIKAIQDRKLDLSENVLTGSKNSSASKLSFQDLCQLFQM